MFTEGAICEKALDFSSSFGHFKSNHQMNGIEINMEQINEKKIVHLFGQEIKKRFGHRLKKIILFGSRARGDSTHDSDYDCLVILNEISPSVKDTIDEIAGEFLYRYNVVLSVFPKLEKEIREHPYSPLLMNAFREGIVL